MFDRTTRLRGSLLLWELSLLMAWLGANFPIRHALGIGGNMQNNFLATIAVCALLTAGCSQAPTEQVQTTALVQATEQEAPTQNTGQQRDDVLDSEEIKKLVVGSYESFDTLGMTETSISDGVEYALLYDPGMEDYQAVMLDRSTGVAELVYETDYFTLFVLYLMAEETQGIFTQEAPHVYLAQDPNYGMIRFFVEDGLVVAAEGEDQSWQSSFEYRVDQELQQVLLQERQVLQDSFEQ